MESQYVLTKDIVFSEIVKQFPDDVKVTSLAENARAFYHYAKKINVQDSTFFMLGSMGQEVSMGLGVSIGIKDAAELRCIVISSDGSFLSNLPALMTISLMKPSKMILLVLDNEMHRITGGQVTASRAVSLCNIARECGMEAYLVHTIEELKQAFRKAKQEEGPIFIQIKINAKVAHSEEIEEAPAVLFHNFSNYIQQHRYDKRTKISKGR